MMDELEAHQRALDVFASVLATVGPEQLVLLSPCAGWDVPAVIDHVVAGNQLVQTRAGREPAALPDDRTIAYAQAAAGAHDVFAAPGGLTRTFETSAGAIPGTVFVRLRAIDGLIHAWDVASATGQPTDLDPELARELLAVARQLMAPRFRGPGRAFGEEQPCRATAAPADQLAAFLGRIV